MVRIRNLLLLAFTIIHYSNVSAQLIRKDHREMTPSEKRTYRDAVISQRVFMLQEAVHHAGHFDTEIHTRGNPINTNGTQFLPWHRLFMLEVEDKLRASGIPNADKITIPYWNWIANSGSSVDVSWNNSGFLDLQPFVSAGFVADNDVDANTAKTAIVRNLSTITVATNTNISDMNTLSNILPTTWQNVGEFSTFFSKRIELFHNRGHGFVGGTMGVFESPADPVFYLHHNFIDKLWQDWEDKETLRKSSFPLPPTTPININDWGGTPPNQTTDARNILVNLNSDASSATRRFEVWFASNKKLLLDGLTGDYDLGQLNMPKRTYCYVAWNGSTVEGTIYAGDVQRDANDNVIADNKGGFIVDGAGADFFAGSAIELRPGFKTVLGSSFSAQIVTTPCGYTTNALTSQQQEDEAFLKAPNTNGNSTISSFKVYPNPVADVLNVEYNVEDDTPLSIDLVNTVGQTVFTKNYGIQSKGIFSTNIQTADLAKGFYTIIVKAGGKQGVQKVVH